MSCARGALVAGFLFVCSGLAMARGPGLSGRIEAAFGVAFPKVAVPGILEVSGNETRVGMPSALPVNQPARPGKIDEASAGASAQVPGEARHGEALSAVDRPSSAANPFAPWKLVPKALPACK